MPATAANTKIAPPAAAPATMPAMGGPTMPTFSVLVPGDDVLMGVITGCFGGDFGLGKAVGSSVGSAAGSGVGTGV